MYFIVEVEEQLKCLPVEKDCFIQVIPGNDNMHPRLTNTSLIYYRSSEKGYIFPINHSEGFSLNLKNIIDFLSKHERVYVLDAKYHSYFLELKNYVDIYFTQENKINRTIEYDCDTKVHQDFYNKRREDENINQIIPITKHYEKCECLYSGIKHYIGMESNLEKERDIIHVYKTIEEQGIGINEELFDEAYKLECKKYSIKDGVLYGQYNLYTLTARPTCTFNGVNLTAIPKEDKYRDSYIPKNEYLIEFDFDAYHLRLIADLVGYKFPENITSIHEYMGKMYFGKDQLTEEEYKESKSISFRQLYGGVEKKYKDIEFLKHMDNFINNIWVKYQDEGKLMLPTGRVILKSKEINKRKLFNYYVQNLETEVNVGKLKKILRLILDMEYKSRIVLITYDAVLLDFSAEDGKDFLISIKNILQEGGTLVKHKYGLTYNFK